MPFRCGWNSVSYHIVTHGCSPFICQHFTMPDLVRMSFYCLKICRFVVGLVAVDVMYIITFGNAAIIMLVYKAVKSLVDRRILIIAGSVVATESYTLKIGILVVVGIRNHIAPLSCTLFLA